MTVVVFDPAAFKQAYPQFAAVSDAVLTNYFNLATLYLSNTDCSIVQDIPKRTTLLWLLTAHIAFLSGALNADGAPSGLVGRISSATEGSVSVSAEMPGNPNAAWFNQTAWGAMFWQSTISLRSFRYRARPTVVEGQYGRPIWGR
jgi:hypothetical protein